MGSTTQAKEKQQEMKEQKQRKLENMKNLALKIFTGNSDDHSMSGNGENSIYSVERNGGKLTGWKRVVAAVTFNKSGHELRLRQDWNEEKNCMMDFPKYKTFFIQKRQEEESPQGRPGESVKDGCEVQSNDEQSSVHSLVEKTKQSSDSTAKCKTSRRLRKSRGKIEITNGESGKGNSPEKDSSQEESKQQNSDCTKAGLPVGTKDFAATSMRIVWTLC